MTIGVKMRYKHVGRIKTNKRKIVVAYRTVPGEPDNCIVVTTQNLMADEHDSLMKLVESDTGQNANEFAEAMQRSQLPDGRNMLAAFHTTGKLIKVSTNDVEMTPDRITVILLSELNQIIAEQRGVSVEDLALSDPTRPKERAQTASDAATEAQDTSADMLNTTDNKALSDEEIAAKYRSDATSLFKEAKRLREEAEKLAPTKKRTSKSNAKTKPKTNDQKVKGEGSDNGPVETDI